MIVSSDLAIHTDLSPKDDQVAHNKGDTFVKMDVLTDNMQSYMMGFVGMQQME